MVERNTYSLKRLDARDGAAKNEGVDARMSINQFNDQFILENQLYSKGLRQHGLEPAIAVGVVFKLNAAFAAWSMTFFDVFTCKGEERREKTDTKCDSIYSLVMAV